MTTLRNLAFIIGINSYHSGIDPLNTAVNDAKKLVEILREKHNYQVWVCLDTVATLANLRNLLEKTLPQQVTSDDRLLFYFAGHGVAVPSDDGPGGYLIPQDAKFGDYKSYLPMTELQESLSKLNCRHFLGILDCCFAGAFRWSSTRDLLVNTDIVYQERYDRFIIDPAWQVISSAASDQKAVDTFSLSSQERGQIGDNSPFATVLIEALCGAADAYYPDESGKLIQDGVITAHELSQYLRDRVETITAKYRVRQTPQLWCLQKHDKGEYIFHNPEHEINLPKAPKLSADNNPYQGLQSFEENHQDLFFGRTALKKKLEDFVIANPLTVVLGASGSGKSSLVKAGLIPVLRNLGWTILPPIRPGKSPLSLISQVDLTPDNQNKFLLIDQSEELITLCQDDAERQEFLQAVASGIAINPKLRVVLTLRSDFEPQLRNSVLQDLWKSARFIVPGMTREELREAIEKPAQERVMYFQPHNLVDKLIDEVANMPGTLPLLSFTLSELYLKYLHRQQEARSYNEIIDRAITEADYHELGGVTQSLTQRAEEEYAALMKQDQNYAQTTRNVMLRMVALGGGELACRRVLLSELEYPQAENQRREEVIKRFAAARLLIPGQDNDGNPYVEPAHDALIKGWSRLRDWVKQEKLDLQRRLTPAAIEWKNVKINQPPSSIKAEAAINLLDRSFSSAEKLFDQVRIKWEQWKPSKQRKDKPGEFLWNGSPYLSVLNAELKSHDNWFNLVENEFVENSITQKRRNIGLRWSITIGGMLVLSTLTLAAFVGQRQAVIGQMLTRSESADGNMRANQLILDALTNSLQAAESLNHPLLRLVQPKEEEKRQVIRTLRKAVYTVREHNRLDGYPGTIETVFWDKDGSLLVASADRDGVVRVWGKSSNQPLAALPATAVTKIIFNQDGSKLAIANEVGNIQLWDWQTQQSPTWKAHEGSVASLRFTSDNSELASLGADNITRVWDINGNLIDQFNQTNNAIAIGFNPNGELLRVTEDSNNVIYLINSANQVLSQLAPLPVSADTATISPNGEQVAIAYGSARSTVRVESFLWDWQNNQIRTLNHDTVFSFSRDGEQLATTGAEPGTIIVRNSDGLEKFQLKGHQSAIANLNFRSDATQLASANADGTLRLWRLGNQELKLLTTLPGKYNSINFTKNNKLIAQETNNTVIYDTSGKQLSSFAGQYSSVSMNPNGKRFIGISEDGIVRLLNLSGRVLREFPERYDFGSNLSFSPDGKRVAIRDTDKGIVTILDSSSGKQLKSLPGFEEGEAFQVITVWTPDNRIIAAGMLQSGRFATGVNFLDLESGQQSTTSFTTYGGSGGEVTSINYNDDASLIGIGQIDGSVNLWYSEGNSLAEYKAHDDQVKDIAISADGSLLATAGEDGTTKLWQLGKLPDLVTQGCKTLQDYLQNNSDVSESNPMCDKKSFVSGTRR
jgi:WD40 repeat protein